MRYGFRRREWHWYDLLLVALAALVVYPDVILEWITERTGRAFHWGHVAILELIGIAVLWWTTTWLMSAYPRFNWWSSLVYVGVMAAFRFGRWCVMRLFNFDN